jgi:lipopolysaccharide/colanic/teichoic acid biosynthesis glycosyltransferase
MRQFLLLFIDLALVAAATAAAILLRDNFELTAEKWIDAAPYLACTLAAAAVVFPAFGTNRCVWQFTTLTDYLRICAATVTTVVSAVALGFAFNRMDGVARALPPLQGLSILFGLVGARVLTRLWHAPADRPAPAKALEATTGHKTVLIVGPGELAHLYSCSVARFAPYRIRIAGVLDADGRHTGRSIHGHPILGTPEQIVDALRKLEVHGVFVDSIVVTTPFDELSRHAQSELLEIEKTSDLSVEFLLDQMGLGLRNDASASLDACSQNIATFAFDDAELSALMRKPYWRAKRVIDIVGACALLAVLAPLGLLAAILAALDVGWPVIFWQQRPGRNGQPFKLYKLRTMAAAHDAHGRRVPDELRVSAIGRLSRRMRFDEFPQLLNILFGEMSFVGPRPLLPVDQPAAYAARLLVRPGLTGWAQVMGGRAISAADKAALDLWYVRNASLALDFEIALRTIAIVVFGERVDQAAIRRAWRELQQAGIYRKSEPDSDRHDSVSLVQATREELAA